MSSTSPTRNIGLRIEYDGTDFVGSQWQNNGRSVQQALEDAWEQLTQDRKRIILAGRTDSGVHARGQVANVRTTTHHDITTIQRGLNAILPEDVAVLDAWEASYDFHARHDAVRRDYRYLIDDDMTESPLLRRHVVRVPKPLDIAAMAQALEPFLGRHDFAAFVAGQHDGSTVRTCYTATCNRMNIFGRQVIAIDMGANAFLHHMVRNIVGTVLLVGEGKHSVEDISRILQSRNRRQAGRTAPAHGLYLMSVTYPTDAV
ncbi:MAG: tRNA U38,U39,U40 pseudouridine synthase TruA [Chloroflexi bacterium AL-W]|nr:tRNA U38,U39,U40 pseudouridine synthase TruA [Chloroflexi bacterium AL-N1]NOK66762.1 tRNA U38,U39,U40 pseudouridine synthase TruA [Chloroflexi bacterium AL-N10]NOK74946.1 tRNA U38,U39,U40 pseudouridine synthase TruA [Chloroflexi bacterium AL-N5]NOK81365.1 tRNA U38,U39,U40 pseudouridine synthase TruA [Chloroflexi bacterium AL-W]NOK88834.1 tRNA U38,U39,U40 pseudouridine synthase TruA [Chloroflexi bacterium AL-N15]